MTTVIRPTPAAAPSRSTLRTMGPVAAGVLANVILSGVADQILHWLGVFPPWGQISYEPGPYALAVSYRTVISVASGYLTARLAPHAPMRHATALGIVGVVLSTVGLVASVAAELGPVWYPALLVLIAFPASKIGGQLYVRRARGN